MIKLSSESLSDYKGETFGRAPQSSEKFICLGTVHNSSSARKINKTDLNRLNRHLNGTQKLTGCYLKAADTNRKKDGVNVLDLVYLNKHLQGKITIQQ